MLSTPTPFSVTSDRQALTVSAAKPKDTFTIKIRNEGIAADTVNVGIDPGQGSADQATQAPDVPAAPAVDPQWFTVEGEPLPIQRQLPPGTDVLVVITVTMPSGGQSAEARREYTFRPYVWSAVRPPRETTVYGPPSTLTVEGAEPPPWWRRYWWILAIAGLVLLVAIAAAVIFALADDPEPEVVDDPTTTTSAPTTSAPSEPVNEAPIARLDVSPLSATTFDKVEADWSRSTDDGGSLTGTIDWGDNTNTGPQAPGSFGHSYSTPGIYKVTLTVDDGAKTATDSRDVTVSWPPFNGDWTNTNPQQILDRLQISGFNGQNANVRIEFALLGQSFTHQGSASLDGQSLRVNFTQSAVTAQMTIQLEGPDLNVHSEWAADLGVLEFNGEQSSRLVRQ